FHLQGFPVGVALSGVENLAARMGDGEGLFSSADVQGARLASGVFDLQNQQRGHPGVVVLLVGGGANFDVAGVASTLGLFGVVLGVRRVSGPGFSGLCFSGLCFGGL